MGKSWPPDQERFLIRRSVFTPVPQVSLPFCSDAFFSLLPLFLHPPFVRRSRINGVFTTLAKSSLYFDVDNLNIGSYIIIIIHSHFSSLL